MPSNSTAVNGDPATGDGSTGWTCAAILTLTVRCPGVLLRVDHLDHPQRQPGVLVGLLDCPVPGGPVEVPHHLDPPGRVRASGEHHPELNRDRTLKSHGPYLQPLTVMLTS
jgi:hypothetical protein